jgi:hypothetical protein
MQPMRRINRSRKLEATIEAVFEHLTKATFVRAFLPTLAASGLAMVRILHGFLHTASFCNLGLWDFGCLGWDVSPQPGLLLYPFRSRSGVCPLFSTETVSLNQQNVPLPYVPNYGDGSL